MKSSEGNLDFLKHRGDLLAALGSGSVADELSDNISLIEEPEGPPVGLIIDSAEEQVTNTLSSLKGLYEDDFSQSGRATNCQKIFDVQSSRTINLRTKEERKEKIFVHQKWIRTKFKGAIYFQSQTAVWRVFSRTLK